MIKIKPLKQTESFCGPCCLKMIFDYYGLNVSISEIAKIANTVVSKGNLGTSPSNMVKSAEHFGFNVRYKENSTLKDIEKFVRSRAPVIINWFSQDEGHYSVVVGIDKKNIYFIDPEYGKVVKMGLAKFQKIWFDYSGDYVKNKKDFRIRPLIIMTK